MIPEGNPGRHARDPMRRSAQTAVVAHCRQRGQSPPHAQNGCQSRSQCYARGHCSLLRPTFPPLRTPHGFACSVASLSRCPCHYRPGRCNFRRAALVEPPPNDGMLCSPQLVLHMHGLPASCVRGCPATRTSTTALMVFVGFQGNPYLHHPRG